MYSSHRALERRLDVHVSISVLMFAGRLVESDEHPAASGGRAEGGQRLSGAPY